MRARKMSTKDGYVVTWNEGHDSVPLRCFGDWQSAAIEFCAILNGRFWDGKENQIKRWAATYDPTEKYGYPEFKRSGVVLRRQKVFDDALSAR